MAQPRSRADRALAAPSQVDAALAPVPDAPATPASVVEAPGLSTYAEGEDAFLHDPSGQLVRVPRELAGRYVVEQGFRPASGEAAEKAKLAAETSVAEEFIKEAGASALSGIGAGVRLPAMVASLAGSEDATDFVRDTSPTAVRAAFAAGWDALRGNEQGAIEQWDDTLKRNRVYEELFPTARMLGRGTGDVAAGLALGGPLGSWAAAGKGALGVAGRSAIAAGAEGASQAALDEYRAAMIENRAVDREHVISNGVIGGVLSAALGGALGGAGKKLSDALAGRRAAGAAAGAADDAARGTPPLADLKAARLAEEALYDLRQTGAAADEIARAEANVARANSKLDDFFAEQGRPVGTRTRDVLRTERAVAEAADELDRPAVELEQTIAEAQARVAKAAQDAGVNPNAQRAAAEAAAEREARAMQDIAGADYDPRLWRDAADPAKVKAIKGLIHKDTILSGGSDELTREGDAMLGGTRKLFRELQEVRHKKAHVAASFAKDGVDETSAIATTLRQQDAFGEALSGVRSKLEADALSGTTAAKRYLQRADKAHTQAARQLAKTDSAADAFIVRDQFRRDLLKLKDEADTFARRGMGDANEAAAVRELQPFINDEYHRAVSTLNDQATWKSYGAFQEAVNGHDGWVGVIKADRIGLRNFADVVDMGEGQDYGREILGFNPEKLRAYLSKIDQPSLRDAELRRIIEKRVSMVSTMREGLELSAAQRAVADQVVESGKKMLSALGDAEKIAIRLNRQAKMNEADKLAVQGGIVTRLMGGLAKAAAGDIKDAAMLQLGGSELVAKQVQALRVQLHGSDSRLARGILKVINAASGEGSENAGALAKIEKRARLGGIINEGAEKLANRMRDQNYALAPIFRPFYDDPEKTPSENRALARELHAKRREALAELVGDPSAMARAVEGPLARATAASPQMGVQLAEEVGTRIQRLQAALPGQDLPSLLPSAPRSKATMISDQELRQAGAYVEATIDPQSVFDDFEKGHLDYDKLRFAKEQYPELFETARAMALDVFRELPADLRGNLATQLDFLLDFEGQLDPSLSPDFLKRQQERFELQQQKTQQPAQNPAPRPAPKTGASAQTYTQRLAGV